MIAGNNKRLLWASIVVLVFAGVVSIASAETLYVDSKTGNDGNLGTQEKPLRTIEQAAAIVNKSTQPGPTTIKLQAGVYNLDKSVVFENTHRYSVERRLTIEAVILPDDSNWKPALMPAILSTEDPRKPEDFGKLTETYGFEIKLSHVTMRGLKFLGNPLTNNWHCCVSRIAHGLEDLLITQCIFVGNNNTFNIYCGALATGDKFVVDHCIFYNCHASVVFWDGTEGIAGKGNVMRYCISYGAHIAGVWTCKTKDDFEFHHNIITQGENFWMRDAGDHIRYRPRDCIVTNNKYYSGYGIPSGATGQTGAEVTYDEKNITKAGNVILVEDKLSRDYLHVPSGAFGSELGAGLFSK